MEVWVKVVDDPRPVDGTLWGQYVRAGHERWEVVRRSWSVFVRNTQELQRLLSLPATNPAISLLLMSDDREATTPYWEELDQRLHNELASAVTLVDHARRLMWTTTVSMATSTNMGPLCGSLLALPRSRRSLPAFLRLLRAAVFKAEPFTLLTSRLQTTINRMSR
jgi:hypothetical protein